MQNLTFTYAFSLYKAELWWRGFYIFFSFLVSVITIFYFVDIFLLLEVKPLINLGYNTLIATQITDLINSVIQSMFFISYVVIFPLFSYHLYFFLLPSLYCYQAKIIQNYLSYAFKLCILSFLLTYIFFLPELFKFFFYWEMKSVDALFQIAVNIRIQEYVIWTLEFYNLLGSGLHLFSCFFIFMLSWHTIKYLFLLFSLYKKQLLFTLVSLCYFVIPPDTMLQLMLLPHLALFIEVIFFIVHFRLKQISIK